MRTQSQEPPIIRSLEQPPPIMSISLCHTAATSPISKWKEILFMISEGVCVCVCLVVCGLIHYACSAYDLPH